MRTLIYIILMFFMLTNQAVPSDKRFSKIPFYLYNTSVIYKIDIALLYAICNVESHCKSDAINHNDGNSAQRAAGLIKKSYGMFQVQLATAKHFGFVDKEVFTINKLKKGKLTKVRKVIDHRSDLLRPEVNAMYAGRYLRHLYNRYHDTAKVVSAYNAGHYTQCNKAYVGKVLTEYAKYKIDSRY